MKNNFSFEQITKHKKIPFYLILIYALFVGCQGEKGDPGERLKADIIGYATLVDEDGTALTTTGVNVDVGNNKSAKTNLIQQYLLKDVQTGFYNFTASYEGFGDSYAYGYSHQGGGNAASFGPNFSLQKISSTKVLSLQRLNADDTAKIQFEIKAKFENEIPKANKSIVLIVSNKTTIDIKNVVPLSIYSYTDRRGIDTYFDRTYFSTILDTTAKGTFTIEYSSFKKYQGTVLYFKAFSCSGADDFYYSSVNKYYNPYSKTTFISSCNDQSSETVEVKIP